MPIKRKQLVTILFLLLTGFGGSAHAALWKIDQVLTGAGVNGFIASGFHRASDSTPMSGTDLGTITAGTGIFGTWDDITGSFNASFNLTGVGGPTFDATGTLLFSGTNLLSGGSLSVDFAGTNLFQGTKTGDLFFLPGNVCCQAIVGPNSLVNSSTGKIMTLWGANGFTGTTYAGGNDTDLGMDLRIHLVQVPEPASVILMVLGVLGLLLVGRRQNSSVTRYRV